MNRPLLRARLRRRIAREYSDGMCYSDACGSVLGSDAIADEVLRRIDGAKGVGDGTLWDLLLAIDWVKLLEVVLAVVAMFKSDAEEVERGVEDIKAGRVVDGPDVEADLREYGTPTEDKYDELCACLMALMDRPQEGSTLAMVQIHMARWSGKPLSEIRSRVQQIIDGDVDSSEHAERSVDRKADKEEAEAKRERLADIDGETA